MNKCTLNNLPLSIETSDREGINKPSRHIVWAIRVYTHRNPSTLQCAVKIDHIIYIERIYNHMENKFRVYFNILWSVDKKKRRHTSGVPRTQSRIWSQAALAADNALESFLALIIAAPRCWTVVMNSPFNLASIVVELSIKNG